MAEHSLQIAVLGVSGRMGRALLTAIDEAPGAKLSGATASANSRWLGKDAGDATGGAKRDVTVEADPAAALRNVQVAIDFTLPEATAANLAACVAARRPVVIGTTGHSEAVRAQIAAAAQSIPIVMAPNMSLGVNLLLKLVELAANKLDADYDIEVFEAHHRNKKDAPSGTALALGAAAADGRDVKLADAAEYSRHGNTGARKRGSIGFSVFRGGDVVGDHTVTFAGIGERIELTHRASDRLAFARGAVKAAQWLVGKSPGLYSMQDVLGL
ncbi:4-hydroxy-tetrahydrodipicolinate reductase [Steroidobacter agaridevorans]|uniref:4-hydroxy-tetrahydrodipicolinate reductase n=1 Tax=Steroidobacter agaridevorans TaxID=2695856 RepID=A0A829YQ01_9GAMM|nr:4-hydroxy-tetrahydrodipicolinate reductase [Steroidobacter agaridevorans]GFE84873.1 4-hydroxy-tetrahydrodipicolinate reductase [Steroidobacter agaridevorans]GFE91846.1 4-hydroxy-tetrahydrodipicolinate reductase [Steroidobacter agaridevorans]